MNEDFFINFDNLRSILLHSRLTSNKDITFENAVLLFNSWSDKYKFNDELKKLTPEQLKSYNIEISKLFENTKETDFFNLFTLIKLAEVYMLENARIQRENAKPKLKPIIFNDFMNLEDKKEYYVKDMFAKGTINMIFSPPASMKSFVSYYLGLCLATGNSFLNQKTKKVNVGYFDWENPLSDIQNRVKGICKGMKFDISKIDNFFFFNKQPTLLKVSRNESYVIEELKEQLIQFVKENDIKVLFFDTLRRLGNFDENDSGAINTIKSELFDPLIVENNVCIIFLHHTSKEGKNYRGSVDIEGVLDTSFMIEKKDNGGIIDLTIRNQKRRNNEIEVINSLVEIENYSIEDNDGSMLEIIDFVKFMRANEQEEKTNKIEYKAIREYFIEHLNINSQYKNKDLSEILSNVFDIKSSTTISKILKWFVEKGILKSFGENKNKYYIINPSQTKEEENKTKYMEKHLHEMFRQNEIIEIEYLKGKLDEQDFSIIVNQWLNLGWLNPSKKGYLQITERYKEQNQVSSILDIEIIEVDN